MAPLGRILRPQRHKVNYGDDGDDLMEESNHSPNAHSDAVGEDSVPNSHGRAPEPDDGPTLFVSQDEDSDAEEIEANGESESEDDGKPAAKRRKTSRKRQPPSVN
jgi:hypothetical protein